MIGISRRSGRNRDRMQRRVTPTNKGAPLGRPVLADGNPALRGFRLLDSFRFTNRRGVNRNLPRFLSFRQLANKIDMKQAILKACSPDLYMIGKLEPSLEGTGGDALVKHLILRAAFVLALLGTTDRQDAFPRLNREVLVRKSRDRDGNAVVVFGCMLD